MVFLVAADIGISVAQLNFTAEKVDIMTIKMIIQAVLKLVL